MARSPRTVAALHGCVRQQGRSHPGWGLRWVPHHPFNGRCYWLIRCFSSHLLRYFDCLCRLCARCIKAQYVAGDCAQQPR